MPHKPGSKCVTTSQRSCQGKGDATEQTRRRQMRGWAMSLLPREPPLATGVFFQGMGDATTMRGRIRSFRGCHRRQVYGFFRDQAMPSPGAHSRVALDTGRAMPPCGADATSQRSFMGRCDATYPSTASKGNSDATKTSSEPRRQGLIFPGMSDATTSIRGWARA